MELARGKWIPTYSVVRSNHYQRGVSRIHTQQPSMIAVCQRLRIGQMLYLHSRPFQDDATAFPASSTFLLLSHKMKGEISIPYPTQDAGQRSEFYHDSHDPTLHRAYLISARTSTDSAAKEDLVYVNHMNLSPSEENAGMESSVRTLGHFEFPAIYGSF